MKLHPIASLPILTILLMGCGQESGVQNIEATRQVESPQVDDSLSGTERFGMRPGSQAAAPAAASQDMASLFDFDAPESWQRAESSQMRLLNFALGSGDETAECYVTILPGDGGGLAANVNRWLGQLGNEPLSPSDVESLPKIPLMSQDATFVETKGSYTGMGGSPVIEDAQLLGAIFIARGRAVFVKMVGTSALVEAERENFERLCATLRPAGDPHAQMSQSGGAQPSAPASAPAASAQGFDPSKLTWQPAEGWRRGRESSMRLITYNAGPEGEAECSVIILSGDGGGLAANINRWAGQMGAEPLSDEQIDALPTVNVLGNDCPLIEISGAYTGMGDANIPDATLLGAICPLEGQSLFIKFTGPAEIMAAERENFVAFCESFAMED